tara:strand:- start:8081 stop:9010 length:930 start_codon:yes stop_codon:yes gene_type:complete
MATIFNQDGTIINTPEVDSLQEDLREAVSNYETHLQSGYDELRTYRDDELKTSDWTQNSDSPLNSTAKTAWATYRTKLRDLPNDAKAPYWFEESDWPVAPGASAINPEALGFLENNKDPLGIATTSWVGLTTNMVEKGSLTVDGSPGIGTNIIAIGSSTGLQIGDHLKNTDSTLIGIISGITSVSVSLASTSPVAITPTVSYFRSDKWYYAQDRPELTYAVSAGATTVASEGNINFTITLTNQASPRPVQWETGESSGSVEIIPSGTTGVSTVTITAPLVTSPDTLYFNLLNNLGQDVGISTTVGVTTT